MRSGLRAIGGKTYQWVHWLFDVESGEAIATCEAVAVAMDLTTRKAIAAAGRTARPPRTAGDRRAGCLTPASCSVVLGLMSNGKTGSRKVLARKQVDPERRVEIGRERRARTRAKIVAAAFDVFGDEKGLYARIEDVADKAGVTRATFYNHFTGMAELREALTFEVTHDFLNAVTKTISQMPDAQTARPAPYASTFIARAPTGAGPGR